MSRDTLVIYHNPRCRKSRETLALIEAANEEVKLVKYLENPPSPKELKLLLAKLDLGVEDLIRKEEPLFKEKFRGRKFTDDEWLIILNENPKLIQRPIVSRGPRAVIGRPPENVQKLL
jgi:arsenate reductase